MRSGQEYGLSGGSFEGGFGEGGGDVGRRHSGNPRGYGRRSGRSEFNPGEYVEEWTRKAEEAVHPLEEYTRERPLRSLLIAAGIGAFVGMFILRR